MDLSIPEALNQAIVAQKSGQLNESEAIYLAILERRPNHPDANHNMGVLNLGRGQEEKALNFFKNALNSNPTIQQYWVSYLEALIKLNRLEEGRRVYHEAETKGVTRDPFYKIRLELDLSNLGSIGEAVIDLPAKQMTPKEVAKKAGIHRDTLLRWLRENLIPEPRRDHRGWRIFSSEEAEVVQRFSKYGKH